MIELERTYLAKFLPNLKKCKKKEVLDVYIPRTRHPKLRIRKNGEKYEITKKVKTDKDVTKSHEHTVPLTKEEFKELIKLKGKQVRKIRHYYPYKGRMGEIDVFQDKLKGLVLIDFEFTNSKEKNAFKMPPFCLAEVKHEEFLAGGMLCGKSYKDIRKRLEKIGYRPLITKI